MLQLRCFGIDKSKKSQIKMKHQKTGKLTMTKTLLAKFPQAILVIPVVILILFAVIIDQVMSQDGSSELTPDKTMSSLPNRLKVRCTDDNLRLYPNATACADEREPESCRMVFTTPISSSPAARDPKCDNPLLKDLADQCRRTCGICCEDSSYACQNDESGIVNCNQNMEKCGMAEFSQMMVKFCPATCGLCLARKCRDQIDECDSMKNLCTNEIYSTFMEHQCARTCGKCGVEGDDNSNEEEAIIEKADKSNRRKNGEDAENENNKSVEERGKEKMSGRPKIEVKSEKKIVKKCVDILKNCHKNKKFCRHESYIKMMKQNCARTCRFCKPSKAERQQPPMRAVDPNCKDNHPFCKGWAANGYCESDEYTDEEKQDKCAKTCGYC